MNKVRTQKHLAILESNFKSSGGEGEMLICYLLQYVCVCVLSHVQLFATLWTVACQAALSMGILPNPGIEPVSS